MLAAVCRDESSATANERFTAAKRMTAGEEEMTAASSETALQLKILELRK
jgi:hypothetical protein